MHLCHIYCKMKQRIHGDDKSHKLIKIVHIYDGGWWNEILLLWISLSFIWTTWGHGYIYFFLFVSWTLMCPFFFIFGSCFLGMPSFLFFLNSPCLIWRILERERSLNMEFYFVDGWNGIANFQCRSLAGGVHVILIKQVWKTSHLGHKDWWSSMQTTRHICVKFCVKKLNIWLW